jgi:DnaJ-class molecular chaperone
MIAASGVRKARPGPSGGGGTQIDAKRPRFTVIHIAGAGFIVLGPDGVKRSEPVEQKHLAQAERDRMQAEADRRAKRGERPCMCCRQTFESEGIHNRLCKTCQGRGGAYSPHAMVLPRRRTS